MRQYNQDFSIEKMAGILGGSCSGYYRFLKAKPSTREQENPALLKEVYKIHQDSYGTYGSPRIHAELKANGEIFSRKRVAQLMKNQGIKAKMAKRFRVTTQQSEKPSFVPPDLIQQNFKAHEPNEAWVSDITFILTLEGWVYCSMILDLFSRKIVSLSLGARITADLVLRALKQALIIDDPLQESCTTQTEELNIQVGL